MLVHIVESYSSHSGKSLSNLDSHQNPVGFERLSQSSLPSENSEKGIRNVKPVETLVSFPEWSGTDFTTPGARHLVLCLPTQD